MSKGVKIKIKIKQLITLYILYIERVFQTSILILKTKYTDNAPLIISKMYLKIIHNV
jgi:hypothetical protein